MPSKRALRQRPKPHCVIALLERDESGDAVKATTALILRGAQPRDFLSMLRSRYPSSMDARQVVEMGDFSKLGTTLEKPPKRNPKDCNDDFPPEYSRSFYRDCGSPWERSKFREYALDAANWRLELILEIASFYGTNVEYTYVYDSGWSAIYTPSGEEVIEA